MGGYPKVFYSKGYRRYCRYLALCLTSSVHLDDLKNEDDPKNEDDLKNEDDIKTKDDIKIKMT